MALASSNDVTLRYIEEVTPGTTPGTPALTEIRFTGEGLNYNITNVTSQEIRNDRMVSDLVQVSGDASGDINFELSDGSFDDLMEGALASRWVADVIINGTEQITYTIQKEIGGIATPQFFMFTGVQIGGMSLSFDTGAILTGSFSTIGLGSTVSATQETGATFPAVSSSDVMNAVSNIIDIEIDDVATTAQFQSMSMDLSNNLRPQDAIGSLPHVDIALGQLEITGNMNIYFEDSSMYDLFLAGTAFKFSFTVQDAAANKYIFTFPKVEFETGEIVAGGLDQDVLLSTTWRSVRDPATDSMINISRA